MERYPGLCAPVLTHSKLCPLAAKESPGETLEGTVQPSGFVRSRADIDKAVQVAKGVKGVKSIKNDMILEGKQ